ncbi:M20/M25/M40 family metallo-hydrolase [bacterium]|nr:M20/M25/M40 family metallo-hydrolase [bacterium]
MKLTHWLFFGFILVIIFIFSCSPKQESFRGNPAYDSLATKMYATALGSGQAYSMLTDLTTNIGSRLSGSPGMEKAVVWAKSQMESLGFDKVWLEPVMVPHWVRGDVEELTVIGPEKKRLTITALGGSRPTPKEGITADVIEVHSFDELKALGETARGKIIFFNRPMDKSLITPFEAYGGAVDQRSKGASEAARAGGVAAIVRSMTMLHDDVPHTGAMRYNDSVPRVPAAAISLVGADFLSQLLAQNKKVTVNLKLSCDTLQDAESFNVIGEITGTEKPNEVVVIGGHLDSWDKGQGAHDDGAGCVQSIEAIRLLKSLGIKPKRTIRAVLFANEENGARGAKDYAAKDRPGEKHIAAMESDGGGSMPRGFEVESDSLALPKIARWSYLFIPIDAGNVKKGGSGTDVEPLYKLGIPAIGLRVVPHRYFDYHHSDHDTIDKVNDRELELGAAAMALLAYVLAQEGI